METSPSNRPATPAAHLRIALVGGGIAGLALALDLARHAHLAITLFESAPAFGEVGAGVSFGPNAIRAMERLGVADAYLETADATPAPWQDVWFEWRRGVDAGLLGTTLAPGVGQSSVHRADYLDVLARRLPEGIARFNKRVVAVTQDAESASLRFADGTVEGFDLVIAADGIRSSVREHVLEGLGAAPAAPIYSGTCAYRGLIDSSVLRERHRAAGLDGHLIDVPQMYLGLDAHILTFPVKKGRLTNVVAFISDRSRPDPQWPADKPWVRTVEQRELLEAFAHWGEAVRILLECIPAPSYWALHRLAELPGYSHGRVSLIGDAAHAMLPHQGAGAGQGLEDAALLADLFADPRVLQTPVDELLKVYDRVRRPRACKVQRTSWENGELYEMRLPGYGDDEERIGRDLAGRFDWLWQHDLGTDIAAARRSLGWAA